MLRFVGAFPFLREEPIQDDLGNKSLRRSRVVWAAAKQVGKSWKKSTGKSEPASGTQQQAGSFVKRNRSRPKRRKANIWNVDLAESDYLPASPVKPEKRGSPLELHVSGIPKVDEEETLQEEEPVISPQWNTFASSNRGVWGGVGAFFSPETAAVQPVAPGSNHYDFRIVSFVDSEAESGSVVRETLWDVSEESRAELVDRLRSDGLAENEDVSELEPDEAEAEIASYEGLQNIKSVEGVMEKVSMTQEPGLVFFEDGTYSRGPAMLLQAKGSVPSSPKFTFDIEQSLVKAGHKRVRFVHTISVDNKTEELEVLQCAVYEEEWLGPVGSRKPELVDLEPLSRSPRLRPRKLVGSWKAFEVSASLHEDKQGDSLVYICREVRQARSLPSEDEEEGGSMICLPGETYMYVELGESGVLRIGAGWLLSEGNSLAIERDYDSNGKLLRVRWKTELCESKM